mgnify:FL=1
MIQEDFLVQYKLRHRFLAFLYYSLVSLAAGTFGIAYGLVVCLPRRDWHAYTHIASLFFRPVFKLFRIQMTVQGLENLPSKSGFVMVANHQSFLDINAVFAGVTHTAFLAKSDLWKIPVFGWIMNNTGSIPIYRKDPKKNAGMGKLIKKRTDQGYNYCVFPEGKRTSDGTMYPFKNGIFRIAKEHKLTIVPISLIDTGKVLSKNTLGLKPGPIQIIIHPPIFPKDYADRSMEYIRDFAHQIIEQALPYKNTPKKDI